MAIGTFLYFLMTILVFVAFLRTTINDMTYQKEGDYIVWANNILECLFSALAWPIILIIILFYWIV